MKQNILLIEVDQMNAECLSILGNPNLKTPHLDKLARESAFFTHNICQQPLCVPSRLSMLTGKYPSTTQQNFSFGQMNRDHITLPQYLKSKGYQTAAFGKFHLTGMGKEQFAFDEAATSMDELEREIPRGNSYKAYCKEHGLGWGTDQLHGCSPLKTSSHSRPDMHKMHKLACESDIPDEHSLEPWTANRCIHYLEENKENQNPFFIWLTFDRPHNPTCLPSNWHERIKPEELELPPFMSEQELLKTSPYVFHCLRDLDSIYSFGDEVFRFILASYYKLIEYLDHHIGRVLTRLKELNLDQNTTIIFTSDHGDHAGWHGASNKTLGVTSGALTKVPLMIRPAPALGPAPAFQTSSPTELLDLFPTICGLIQEPIPAGLEGQDLSACLLSGREPDPSRAVFSEAMSRKMVTKNQWKLVMHSADDREALLFNLEEDPNGYHNLYADDLWIEQRVRLKCELLKFMCMRQYGTYTETDIANLHEHLEPGSYASGNNLIGSMQGLYPLRCALYINGLAHGVFVPFYDAELMLFDAGHWNDRTFEDALPMNLKSCEPELDYAFKRLMRQQRPICPFESIDEINTLPEPTPERVREMLAKVGQ